MTYIGFGTHYAGKLVKFCLTLTFLTGRLWAEDIAVSDALALDKALAAAKPGDRLVLASGDYGALNLRKVSFDPALTIIEQNGADVRFSHLSLRNVSGLALVGLTFDYHFQPGDKLTTRPFSVQDSQHIAFDKVRFDGDEARGLGPIDDGFPTGQGLFVARSSEVSLNKCSFERFHKAAQFLDVSDLKITNCEFQHLRSDAINLAAITRGLIRANHIHDFTRSPASADHPDMIQLWTTNTSKPTQNLTITENLLDVGQGLWTQSIFLRNDAVDQGRAGEEMFLRDITITNNIIRNAHTHGISVGETIGLTISGNVLVRVFSAAGPGGNPRMWTPQIHVSPRAKQVIISDNQSTELRG